MGKAGRRSQWALVLAILGVALLLTGALFIPGALDPGDRVGGGRFAGGGAGTGPDEPEEAPQPPEEAQSGDSGADLPPYGDKTLPREESIRGRVVDAEGAPVADAVVSATYREARRQPATLETAGLVRTEEDGSFVIGPLTRQVYSLVAVKEGAGVASSGGQQPGAWVELVLGPGARLEGVVSNRDTREPLAGAVVVVHDPTFRTQATTDEEGRYLFEALPPPGNAWIGFSVVAVAEGFRRGERSNFPAMSGGGYRLDFALDRGSALTGRVFDGTGQPLAAATVGEGWEPFHRRVETKPDGSYVLPNVDISPNLVFVAAAPGYLPQQRQSDGTGTLDFGLDASLAVEGVVIDRADAPARGARVYLHRISYAPGFQPDSTNQQTSVATSGADGRFRFDEVLPGQVAIIAFHHAHAPGEEHPVEVPPGGPGPTDVRVRLRGGLTVEGEVRDRAENPLADVRVTIQGWEAAPGYAYAIQYRWQESPIAFTDAEGRFLLRGALPGRQWLNAYDARYGWTGQQVQGVDGERLTGVKISFSGGSIEGRVLGADGGPATGGWVSALGPKNTPQQSQRYAPADALGRFRIGGLPEGRYDLHVNIPGTSAEPLLDVPTGTTDAEIRLQATHVLACDVRSSVTGRAVERFFLTIQAQRQPGSRRRGGSSWAGQVQTPDGRFERPVAPGEYKLVVKAPRHAPKVIERVVVEELMAPPPLAVVLDAGGGIEGTLRDPDGRPLPNAWVNARLFTGTGSGQAGWMLGGNDQTDSRGRYFIEGLGAGTYVLQANMGAGGAATARVSVAGAEMVRHDLTLRPTGFVRTKVVTEEGKPLPEVQVQFWDDQGEWLGWGGQTNAQGEARSQPMRAGPAILRVLHVRQEYFADDLRIEIPSGQTLDVEVNVRKSGEAPGR